MAANQSLFRPLSLCHLHGSCPGTEKHWRSLTFDLQHHADTRVRLVGARAMKSSETYDVISIQVDLNQSHEDHGGVGFEPIDGMCV